MFVAVLRGWATMTLGHRSSLAGLVRHELCHDVVINLFRAHAGMSNLAVRNGAFEPHPLTSLALAGSELIMVDPGR